MYKQAANEIFMYLADNEFPILATEKESCETPCLSHHINRMLTIYYENKHLYQIPGISALNQELFDLIIKVAILFHDLGKLNCFFQFRMLKPRAKRNQIKIKKNWSYHTDLSAFIAFLFINHLKRKMSHQFKNNNNFKIKLIWENFDVIIINAIICHHSALYHIEDRNQFKGFQNDKDYFVNMIIFFFKYLKLSVNKYLALLDKDIINSGLVFSLKTTHINIDLNRELTEFFDELSVSINQREDDEPSYKRVIINLITKFNKEARYKYDSNTKHEPLFFYIVQLASLLTNLDKWEAKTTRSYYFNDKELTFSNQMKETIVKNPIGKIQQYKLSQTRQSNLTSIREHFAKIIAEKNLQSQPRKIYTLTAPCGIGKTLAALDFAFNLRGKFFQENGYFPKIIYALPFISICDQLEEIMIKVFEKESQTDFLTVHHTMADFEKNLNDWEDENINQEEGYLKTYEISNWYSEVIITTLVKLFNTMLTFYKHTLTRFHRMTNSIIIIDEYHSIPKKYHDLVRIYLKTFSSMFNATFVLLTATTPALFQSKDEIIELTAKSDNTISNTSGIELFQKINRYKIRFHYPRFSFDEFSKFCINVLEDHFDQNIMIVVNRRALAKITFERLSEFIETLNIKKGRDDKPEQIEHLIFHLSGNMIPVHRKRILQQIETIMKCKTKDNRIILVTTQLIEAGIDISFHKIIRDWGPLYSIVQVAGRCNRNWEIQDEENLPVVDVINIDGSHKFVYDDIDIEQTRSFFENHHVNINNPYTELTEKEIQKTFVEFPEKLDDVKLRDQCLKEFQTLNFQALTQDFQLIKELPRVIIVVLPDSTKTENQIDLDKEIKARNTLDKMRRNELVYFPLILYQYVVEVYEKNRIFLDTIAYNLENGRNINPKRVLEKFDHRNVNFFILDLMNPGAREYYSEEIGINLPD